jgi:hypothetical protein
MAHWQSTAPYIHGGVNLAANKSCADVVIFSCLSAPAANIQALHRGQADGPPRRPTLPA